jgi:hypothetical protein
MAIIATSTTLYGQTIPKICLTGDQTQGYVYDTDSNCFVEAESSSDGCSTTTNSTDSADCSADMINCYNATGDGTTAGFVIPWSAINEQSLIVTLDGIKQYDDDYAITVGTESTLVTFASAPALDVSIEITGFQVTDSDRIKRYEWVADGSGSSITLNWTAVSKHSLVVSIDGVIKRSAEYTITYTPSGATVLTFNVLPSINQEVEVIGIRGFGASTYRIFVATGDNATKNYTIPWYAISCGSLLITINGVKQHSDLYTVTPLTEASTTVSFVTAPAYPDNIEIIGYTGFDSDLCETCGVIGNNLSIIGEGIYSSASEADGITTLDFKTLIGGTGINLTSTDNDITIASLSDVSSFSNLGGGVEVLIEPVVTGVTYRTLNAGDGITLTENAETIDIAFDGDADFLGGVGASSYATTILAASGGTGESVIKKGSAYSNNTFELFTIKEGSGITITTVNDDIVIADANGGNYVKIIDDYTVERDDAVVGVADTTAERTITLPDAGLSGEGKNLVIKDETDAASGNPITISGFGGQFINGAGSIQISDNGGSVRLYTDGTEWFTTEVSIGTGLTELAGDLTPELGGDLDVSDYAIVSTTNRDIILTPDGTGSLVLDGFVWPAADGANGSALLTDGSGNLYFGTQDVPVSLDDLTDVDLTTTAPVTNDALVYDGANWTPSPQPTSEDVVLKYTAGAGGDLSAIDAVVSETAGITATVIDGVNCVVEFTFSGYAFPPVSIMSYGQDHENNQWNIRDASSFIGSRAISDDTSGDANNPDLINPATGTPSIELQLRQSDTGASAAFSSRANLFLRFLMAG